MISAGLVAAVQVLLFPGFAFIIFLAFFYQWIDRKVVARLQNRYGPLHTGPSGILQPLADFVKLLAKEDIEPTGADKLLFRVTPALMLVLPLVALFSIPIVAPRSIISFEGDLLWVIFLITMIVVSVFLSGWACPSSFSSVGGTRAALQLLGYEVPLTVSLVGPAIAAGSLSITRIVEWQVATGLWTIFLQPIGFAIVLICMLAEIEVVPFDIPEAETEIVAGWQTEYSGRKLALIRLSHDVEVVLATGLMVALYLGGPAGLHPSLGILWFLLKTIALLFVISNLRALFARFRIDQMVSGCWKYLVPLSIVQIVAVEFMLM